MTTDKKSAPVAPGGAGAGGPGGDKKDEKKEDTVKIWNDSEVQLLKKWGETAASYRLLHDRAYRYYETRAFRYNVPIIILSTVTGTASFSQTLFPPEYQPFVPMVIGSLNIFTGILGTLSRFYRLDELTESHRVASISYGKYARNISTELSLPPSNRRYNGADMVEMCRSEMDRLIEQSPIIPMFILLEFKENKDFKHINKPEVLDIKPIEEYKMSKEEKVVEIVTSVVERLKQVKPEKTLVQQMAERHGGGGGPVTGAPPTKQALQNIVHNVMMNRDAHGTAFNQVAANPYANAAMVGMPGMNAGGVNGYNGGSPPGSGNGGGSGVGVLTRPPSITISGSGGISQSFQMPNGGGGVSADAIAALAGVGAGDAPSLENALAAASSTVATVIPTADALLGKAEQLVAEQRENIKNEIENVITPGTVSAAKTLFRNMAKKAVSKERLSQAAKNIVQTAAQSTVPHLLDEVNQTVVDLEAGIRGDGNGGGGDESS